MINKNIMIDEELRGLIQKNQETLEDLEKRVRAIQKKLLWHTISGFIKFILIVGPLIVGFIYLSPIVKQYLSGLKPILEMLQIGPSAIQDMFVNFNAPVEVDNSINSEALEFLCDPGQRDAIIQSICK